MFVFLLGGYLVALILHFEHDRGDFGPQLVHVPVNLAPFAAATRVVVLLKLRALECSGSNSIEFRLAMLLEG